MRPLKITVPTPFEIGPVNVYLIEDEQLALIDTGPKTDEALEALRAGLAQAGYSIRDVDYVIVTHEHEDHYGLARFIKDQSRARTYAHKASLPLLTRRESEFHLIYEVAHKQLLQSAGVPEEAVAAIQPTVKLLEACGDQVKVDKALEEGDIVRVGRTKLTVVHTPGHAEGAICLYSAEDKALFSGDHLLAHVSSNAVVIDPLDCGDCRSRSLVDYVASLRRVHGMDLEIVYPGHGEEILDHRSLIEVRMRFYERRKAEILSALGDAEKTPYELAMDVFAGLRPFEVFLAVSEVIGHLDLLEDEGKVTWRNTSGVIRYRRE